MEAPHDGREEAGLPGREDPAGESARRRTLTMPAGGLPGPPARAVTGGTDGAAPRPRDRRFPIFEGETK